MMVIVPMDTSMDPTILLAEERKEIFEVNQNWSSTR